MSQKKTKTDRSKSKDNKRASQSFSQDLSTLEDFEDRILEVDLKKNRSAKAIFNSEIFHAEHSGEKLMEAMPKINKKWTALPDIKRKKYETLAEEEKARYEEHLGLVRKHLISKPLKEKATAYLIFRDEAAKKAIENLQDVKEAREKARDEWHNMSGKEKEKWEEKKNANHELYEKLKSSKPGNVNAYALWVKDEIANAREKGNKTTITECAARWGKVNEKTKEKYQEYADELRAEKEKQRDLYEITFGIKPRRPLGPYNFFLQEMAKLKKYQGSNFFKECSKAWAKITDTDKERYERISKRDRLIYMVKKIEFNNYKRSTFKRAPSAYNLYVADMREKTSDKEMSNTQAFEYISDKWKKESDAVKKKYQKQAEVLKKDNAQEKENYENRVFDAPKRPRSGYQLYLIERMPELKEKSSNDTTADIMKKIAVEWKGLKDSKKEKYNEQAVPGRELYKSKMKEFEKYGYYNLDDKEIEEKSAKKMARSQSQKERSKSAGKSQKKSKK